MHLPLSAVSYFTVTPPLDPTAFTGYINTIQLSITLTNSHTLTLTFWSHKHHSSHITLHQQTPKKPPSPPMTTGCSIDLRLRPSALAPPPPSPASPATTTHQAPLSKRHSSINTIMSTKRIAKVRCPPCASPPSQHPPNIAGIRRNQPKPPRRLLRRPPPLRNPPHMAHHPLPSSRIPLPPR